MIRAWVLPPPQGAEPPRSLATLEAAASPTWLTVEELKPQAKWGALLSEGAADAPDGWVTLADLATVRRGVATGCNSFFMLSRDGLRQAGVAPQHQMPCVARAQQVSGTVFRKADWTRLYEANAAVTLVNFSQNLTGAEQDYIAKGVADGLPSRYLLSRRDPWYSMEQRPVAPIWGSVFGRSGFRFVLNEAGAQCLTAFHGIHPVSQDPLFVQALCGLLNRPETLERLTRLGRLYGGGLRKLEPRDLASVPVPDLRHASEAELLALAHGDQAA